MVERSHHDPFLGSSTDIVVDVLDENDKGTGFKRTILISEYTGDLVESDSLDAVLVQSKIEWKLGAKDRELVLSEVLTDWKGGAL